MGKLSENEIKKIVQKATLLQKFSQSKSPRDFDKEHDELDQLFEITDDLDLDRSYVHEAYLDLKGIPVIDPIIVDTHSFNTTEVMGIASGKVDSELVNELKARIEYYFNTVGKVSNRRNKITWKAKPSGFSKIIASSSSPEVEFKDEETFTRISIRQSLKTINKFYLPALASGFGAFMLLAAVIFDQVGSEIAPPLIFSGLIFLGTFFYTRFINGRKKKKKQSLVELTEVLQQAMERKFKASSSFNLKEEEKQKRKIEIPEEESSASEEIEVSSKQRIKE